MYAPTPPIRRSNLGFLLAKASQRWNEQLAERFNALGYPEVRPSFGSVLVPLFEQDGLRIVEIAHRSGISKQTLTTLLRQVENAGLIYRSEDPEDKRAARIRLSAKGHAFAQIARGVVHEMEQQAIALLEDLPAEQLVAWLKRYTDIQEAGGTDV